MKKKVTMFMLAAKIEWNWAIIMRARKKVNRIIGAGKPLSSKRLLLLDAKITRHGMKAKKAQHRYEDLAGITEILKQTA